MSVPVITPVSMDGYTRGGSQPARILCSDGHTYVVKNERNPQTPMVRANELIASLIGHELGLPLPQVAIVDISDEFINQTQLCARMDGQIVPWAGGLCFGSRMPPASDGPIYDYLPDTVSHRLELPRCFAGLMLFDKWLTNCDGRQVVFTRTDPARAGGPYRVLAIDHGFCFNAHDWDFPDSPMRGVYGRNFVYDGIRGWADFEPWISRIESFGMDKLRAIAAEVPKSWHHPRKSLLDLMDTLYERRSIVRTLVEQVRDSQREPFTNWRRERAAVA